MDEHIKEYFRLTGRPISTMTVSEYLEFLNFNSVPKSDISSHSSDISVHDNVTTPVSEEKHTEKPAEKPKSAAVQKQKNNSALEMLKSVKG